MKNIFLAFEKSNKRFIAANTNKKTVSGIASQSLRYTAAEQGVKPRDLYDIIEIPEKEFSGFAYIYNK